MRKPLLFIFSFFCLSVQAQVTFQKRYGGLDFDFGACVRATADGGYAISGNTNSFGGFSNGYLIKTDGSGTVQWTKIYDYGEYFEAGYSMLQAKDGGFIISGFKYNMVNPNSNGFFLLKTFSDGTLQWTKSFPGGDYISSVLETDDKEIVVAGSTYQSGAGNFDFYLLKTDSVGNLLWAKSYGGTSVDKAYCVKQTNDGGFIISGYTLSFSGNYDTYLVKTYSDGTLEWSKTYSNTYGLGNYVLQANDGGYIITSQGLRIIKTLSDGSLQWAKIYSGASAAYSMGQTGDNGYIISGGIGNGKAYLLKIDTAGTVQWERGYGQAANVQFVEETNDNGYIAVGNTYGLGAQVSDVYLIKTDSNGNTSCNDSIPLTTVNSVVVTVSNPLTQVFSSSASFIEPMNFDTGGYEVTLCLSTEVHEIINVQQIAIFPNPSSGIFTVDTRKCQDARLSVYDVLGNCLLGKYCQGETSQEINLSGQPRGVYFLEILSDGEKTVRKIVLQ